MYVCMYVCKFAVCVSQWPAKSSLLYTMHAWCIICVCIDMCMYLHVIVLYKHSVYTQRTEIQHVRALLQHAWTSALVCVWTSLVTFVSYVCIYVYMYLCDFCRLCIFVCLVELCVRCMHARCLNSRSACCQQPCVYVRVQVLLVTCVCKSC